MKQILYLFFCCLFLQSCFVGKAIEVPKLKEKFSEENNAIPPDFGKDDTILLVMLRGRKSYDKYVLKAVQNNYFGKYIFVEAKDFYAGTYADREVYKYIFDYTDGSTSTALYSDGMQSSVTAKRFYVKDRLNEKMYQSGAESAYFAKALEAYFINLEEKRKSFN
ncbi:conserved exported hypothetical protein [Flavobacterium sp. 9AF]|uniref:hypothetical protein n=1 Tax=Flavobacterium sp. 9AF TaxID=2653142 RepID=UPI0012EFC1B3|nr:hypothetical protein [Flavobacterium sp. 9AF]VXB37047.1 conserved exported hypothetical protein [Flavobacterium sp. 9AF]